tara:strand:- start:3797 stop:4405 length:609 start_codon:yes stop_codon:yes gene_type:complete
MWLTKDSDPYYTDLRKRQRQEWIEKYNKNHDPKTGRFTSGPGGMVPGGEGVAVKDKALSAALKPKSGSDEETAMGSAKLGKQGHLDVVDYDPANHSVTVDMFPDGGAVKSGRVGKGETVSAEVFLDPLNGSITEVNWSRSDRSTMLAEPGGGPARAFVAPSSSGTVTSPKSMTGAASEMWQKKNTPKVSQYEKDKYKDWSKA